jgi:2-polyprenyl-3-methyl-5-hydroxy-6-metoxy-1,4-benzoquinol methylase/uncharacterized protein YbaR (Trm112 family)
LSAAAQTSETLLCPVCRRELASEGNGVLGCSRCARRYPVVAGIPDLRLPDGRSWSEDLDEARELAARFDEVDLAELLRMHWRRSGKSRELTERFVARDLAALERSKVYLQEIEKTRGTSFGSADSFLEVGCGTAGLAAAAAERCGRVVATDIAMVWLILAKKLLTATGVTDVQLVCCDAAEMPFAPGSFDVVAASDVIEHVPRQDAFVAGCHRMLLPGGMLFLATPNRFSLGLEPHVRLWGVGFLPRPIAKRYVRGLRKTPYDGVRLLSARELTQLLRSRGFEPKVVSPAIPPSTERMYSGLERRLVRIYNRVRAIRPMPRLLRAVGPFFHVFATKERA